MNKKFISLGAGLMLFGLVGCQGNTNQPKPKAEEKLPQITLSKEEKEIANGNANIGAQLLVRKAVLEDMKKVALNEKEKFEIQFVKDEAAIAYYLHKVAGNDIKVSEETIKKVYDDNKAQIGDKKLKDVHDELEYLIVQRIQNDRIVDYYNSLVEKYKLNDALKAEFAEPETAPEAKETAPEAKKEEKK